MKVLVLNGSPKGNNSNSLALTSAFCEGLSSKVSLECEIIPVYRMNIKPCMGCFQCWHKTPGQCCIKDDMAPVLQKMLDADVIIWSFPLYYYSLPSQLKALMDRQLPLSLPVMSENSESGSHPSRYDMSGKRCVVISTCGFYTAKGNYDAVTYQFNRCMGKRDGFYSIYCGQGELFHAADLSLEGHPDLSILFSEIKKRTAEYLQYVRQAGEEFAAGDVSEATGMKLTELLFPKDVFEKNVNRLCADHHKIHSL